MAIDYRLGDGLSCQANFYKFAGAKYFLEFDLCKACYQIPLTENVKPLNAFSTHKDLMEFSCLLFDLVTACATYIRLMRIVLASLSNVSFNFVNIFVYSTDRSHQVSFLRFVLLSLRGTSS